MQAKEARTLALSQVDARLQLDVEHLRGLLQSNCVPVLLFPTICSAACSIVMAFLFAHFLSDGEVVCIGVATREAINQVAGHRPVLIHAGDWGFVHRDRLFWGCGCIGALLRQDFVDDLPAEECADGVHGARWLGAHQHTGSPRLVYKVKHQAAEELKGPSAAESLRVPTYSKPRFTNLAKCFPHPPDHGNPRRCSALQSRWSQIYCATLLCAQPGMARPLPYYVSQWARAAHGFSSRFHHLVGNKEAVDYRNMWQQRALSLPRTWRTSHVTLLLSRSSGCQLQQSSSCRTPTEGSPSKSPSASRCSSLCYHLRFNTWYHSVPSIIWAPFWYCDPTDLCTHAFHGNYSKSVLLGSSTRFRQTTPPSCSKSWRR